MHYLLHVCLTPYRACPYSKCQYVSEWGHCDGHSSMFHGVSHSNVYWGIIQILGKVIQSLDGHKHVIHTKTCTQKKCYHSCHTKWSVNHIAPKACYKSEKLYTTWHLNCHARWTCAPHCTSVTVAMQDKLVHHSAPQLPCKMNLCTTLHISCHK